MAFFFLNISALLATKITMNKLFPSEDRSGQNKRGSQDLEKSEASVYC